MRMMMVINGREFTLYVITILSFLAAAVTFMFLSVLASPWWIISQFISVCVVFIASEMED